MIKKLLLAIALILPVSLFAQDSKESKDLKFGYVNRAELFQSMPETVAATKKVEDYQKKCDADLKIVQDEYQKKASDFVATKDSLPEAIRTRRVAEINDLQQRLQSFYQEYQKAIEKQYQDLMAPINEKLMAAIKAVGDENGYVYIFDVSANAGMAYWSTTKCDDVNPKVRAKLNLK